MRTHLAVYDDATRAGGLPQVICAELRDTILRSSLSPESKSAPKSHRANTFSISYRFITTRTAPLSSFLEASSIVTLPNIDRHRLMAARHARYDLSLLAFCQDFHNRLAHYTCTLAKKKA